MQLNRIHNQPSAEVLKKEIIYYHTLAEIYTALKNHKRYPFAREMILECYRAASTIDDSVAQYALSKALLDEAKMREQLKTEGIFASSYNERRINQLYEEALAYLIAAEKLGHILAKRMRGLCYINGWGVELDREKGFGLVVDSIDQENSWDRVSYIFAAIGLNKPEFFSALTKHRSKSQFS